MDGPESTSKEWFSMLLNTTPDPFFDFRFLLKIENLLKMIYEESI